MEVKSKAEIIEEVASFYNLTNRGFDETTDSCCYYVFEKGQEKTCAVGRYLKSEFKTEEFADKHTFDNIADVLEYKETRTLDYILIPEVQGHELEFWENMQNFHDSEANFTTEGLSEIGEMEKQRLIQKWGNR